MRTLFWALITIGQTIVSVTAVLVALYVLLAVCTAWLPK